MAEGWRGFIRQRRSVIAGLHDLLAAAISFPIALYIRLGGAFYAYGEPYLVKTLPIFLLVFAVCAFSWRLHRGVWRFVSLNEFRVIAQVSALTIILFYALLFVLYRLEGIPRSVPLVHWMVLMAALAGPRAAYRSLRDLERDHRAEPAIPVLLVGASHHAEQFVRALQRTPAASYRVEAMLDDAGEYQGRTLHGVPVMGRLDSLEHSVKKLERRGARPQRILLSEDYLDEETVSALLDASDRLGIPLARLPRLTEFQEEFTGGQVPIKPVRIEDLLGRSQNVHDRDGMRRLITGKTVLVTGAGGSIGSELVRQIAGLGPLSILLYDHSEYNLYEIDRELAGLAPLIARRAILGDVRDMGHLDAVFAQHAPQIVFHAAAIKHVPLAEANVVETLATNVVGTENVARAAAKHQAEAFVLISTDKAVNPANVMGAAKRLAERCVANIAGQGAATRFTTVRFGNVLGSRGSVVPLFQRQLAEGGPLTVTHPEIERYFMTIREAVELVLQSAAMHMALGESARIFVLDMGKPVKIDRLARQMIRLAGLKPDHDVKIVYTGLRPGEKMFEELFYNAEELEKTAHASIMLARPQAAPGDTFAGELWKLKDALAARDEVRGRTLLSQLVPEAQLQ